MLFNGSAPKPPTIDHHPVTRLSLLMRFYYCSLVWVCGPVRSCRWVWMAIDWDNGRITIRCKGGRSALQPLSADVGEAIAIYLMWCPHEHCERSVRQFQNWKRATIWPWRGRGVGKEAGVAAAGLNAVAFIAAGLIHPKPPVAWPWFRVCVANALVLVGALSPVRLKM